MACSFDLNPLAPRANTLLRSGQYPKKVQAWVNAQLGPDAPHVGVEMMRRHRRDCLGLPPFKIGGFTAKTQPSEQPLPAEPKPRASEALGRTVTEDDIETRLLTRFYDTIDEIAPEKIAEYMIEREKARQRGVRSPAGRSKEPPQGEDAEDPRAALARRIGMATGARPTKTGVRMRRVK